MPGEVKISVPAKSSQNEWFLEILVRVHTNALFINFAFPRTFLTATGFYQSWSSSFFARI